MSEHISVNEAAEMAGVSERTIRRWVANGYIAGQKIRGSSGDEWRIDPDSLNEYLHESEHLRNRGREDGGRFLPAGSLSQEKTSRLERVVRELQDSTGEAARAREEMQEAIKSLSAAATGILQASEERFKEVMQILTDSARAEAEKWKAILEAERAKWEVERKKYEQIIDALETEVEELRKELRNCAADVRKSRGLMLRVKSVLGRERTGVKKTAEPVR